jgi:hypothetical protein
MESLKSIRCLSNTISPTRARGITTPSYNWIEQRRDRVQRRDSCGSHTSVWHMSVVYWGIVFGIAALVATFFVCFNLVYPNAKGSGKGLSATNDGPIEAAEQPAVRSRYAA